MQKIFIALLSLISSSALALIDTRFPESLTYMSKANLTRENLYFRLTMTLYQAEARHRPLPSHQRHHLFPLQVGVRRLPVHPLKALLHPVQALRYRVR